jgi:hypothetical protein
MSDETAHEWGARILVLTRSRFPAGMTTRKAKAKAKAKDFA